MEDMMGDDAVITVSPFILNAKTGETLRGMLRWKVEGVKEGAAAQAALKIRAHACA